MWFKKLRQGVCRHDFQDVGRRPTGAVLGWGFAVAREFTVLSLCRKCGHEHEERGNVYIGDRLVHPEAYNAHGWPLDEAGNPLPGYYL